MRGLLVPKNERHTLSLKPFVMAAVNNSFGNAQLIPRYNAELLTSKSLGHLRPRECSPRWLMQQWIDEGTYVRRMLTEYWTVRHDNAELTPSLKQLLSADMDFFKSIVHKETTLEQAWNPAQKDMIVDTLKLLQNQIDHVPQKLNSNKDLARRLCLVLARKTLKEISPPAAK